MIMHSKNSAQFWVEPQVTELFDAAGEVLQFMSFFSHRRRRRRLSWAQECNSCRIYKREILLGQFNL